jgi:hypothetical protein
VFSAGGSFAKDEGIWEDAGCNTDVAVKENNAS